MFYILSRLKEQYHTVDTSLNYTTKGISRLIIFCQIMSVFFKNLISYIAKRYL